jgi:hypothetical protein
LANYILLFQTGRIEPKPKIDFYSFVITGAKNCEAVIQQYFDKFPFKTQKKQKSLKFFKELINEIKNKNHMQPNLLPNLIQK